MSLVTAAGVLVLLAVGGLMLMKPQKPSSSATVYTLDTIELARQEALARGGDCSAALQLAHHYSLGRNQSAEAIPWLRLASKCQSPSVMAELAMLLLGAEPFPAVESEVLALTARIAPMDPQQADAVRAEVDLARKRWQGRAPSAP